MKTHKQHIAETREYHRLKEALEALETAIRLIPGWRLSNGSVILTGHHRMACGDAHLDGLADDFEKAHGKLTACIADWDRMWAKHEDIAAPVSSRMRVEGAVA